MSISDQATKNLRSEIIKTRLRKRGIVDSSFLLFYVDLEVGYIVLDHYRE